MPNEHAEFWFAFLNHVLQMDKRTRLWNGYLGWKLPPEAKADCKSRKNRPPFAAEPPEGGWPQLTEEEKEEIDKLARAKGGHPTFGYRNFMDFTNLAFPDPTDLSGLIFYNATFHNVRFEGSVRCSMARFYGHTEFDNATFEDLVECYKSYFGAGVSFAKSVFKYKCYFGRVEFNGGASFANAVFKDDIWFNDSKFEQKQFPESFGSFPQRQILG